MSTSGSAGGGAEGGPSVVREAAEGEHARAGRGHHRRDAPVTPCLHSDTQGEPGSEACGSARGPGINKDVKSWFEGAGWKDPSEVARGGRELPLDISEAGRAEDSGQLGGIWPTTPAQKGFACGFITPIVHCLNAGLPVINSKVVKTYAAGRPGGSGWLDEISWHWTLPVREPGPPRGARGETRRTRAARPRRVGHILPLVRVEAPRRAGYVIGVSEEHGRRQDSDRGRLRESSTTCRELSMDALCKEPCEAQRRRTPPSDQIRGGGVRSVAFEGARIRG